MRVLDYIKQAIKLFRSGRSISSISKDIRSPYDKGKDYRLGEDVILPGYTISKRIKKMPFEPYNQGRTSACGAYAASHGRKFITGESNFPPIWYRWRSNYANEGMFLKEVLELMAKAETFPAPKGMQETLTEKLVNSFAFVDVMKNKRDDLEYFTIKPYDSKGVFDSVSSGYPTVISVYASEKEWDEEVYVRDNVFISTAPIRHYCVAIPNSTHSNGGHEWVSVIDSAKFNGRQLRHVRKDFLDERMYIGGGFVKPKGKPVTTERFVPQERCQYAQSGKSVVNLQKYLLSYGFIQPENVTGYYGNITAKAVLRWQLENGVNLPYTELIDLGGWYWGPASIKRANEIDTQK